MITSTANAKIKHLKELQLKSRARNRESLFVAEGFKMFLEAPKQLIKEVYIDDVTYNKMEECSKNAPSTNLGASYTKLKELEANRVLIETLSADVFKRASDTESPQGILFVMTMPVYSYKDILGGNILILEDIQDPGNLGTMVRTAEGAGISGIVMTKGTVDIFNPKTIRSTMGSLFRVPFVTTDNMPSFIAQLKKDNVKIYAAHLKGELDYDKVQYIENSAFMIGNEGNGLTDELSSLADMYIKIPMSGQLESLNASIAAALLMYRARKQD